MSKGVFLKNAIPRAGRPARGIVLCSKLFATATEIAAYVFTGVLIAAKEQ